MYLIFVFGQAMKNEYIRYSYSVRLQETNIFDIHIRKKSECGKIGPTGSRNY